MAEFKAQLLGILLVISIFGALAAGYKLLVKNSLDSINSELSSQVVNINK